MINAGKIDRLSVRLLSERKQSVEQIRLKKASVAGVVIINSVDKNKSDGVHQVFHIIRGAGKRYKAVKTYLVGGAVGEITTGQPENKHVDGKTDSCQIGNLPFS